MTCSSSCSVRATRSTTLCSKDSRGQFPGKCWAYLGFSDDLAHQIEAGADLFLMPSLFEPCGLNQLYSLAHGTVPIVRATGGLVDTVVDTNPRLWPPAPQTVSSSPKPMPRRSAQCIDRALSLWPDRQTWRQLMTTGMKADWSWQRSAREYVGCYEEIKRTALARNIPRIRATRRARADCTVGNSLSLRPGRFRAIDDERAILLEGVG